MVKLFGILAFAGLSISTIGQQMKQVSAEFITDDPPFASCHASTIIDMPGNRLLAAWFAGQYESHNRVAIWLSVKEGGKWQDPFKIADGVVNDTLSYACWNPVLFRTKEGKVLLFYKVGPSPREWWGVLKTSSDNGKTWSAGEKLPSGMLGPIKNKPVQLRDGSILYPTSSESVVGDIWHIHMEKSDKDGKNWKKISIDNDTFGAIQPSVLIHPGGRLQLLCRSRQGYVVQSWSTDNGESWSKITKTNLPNPNSGTDAVTLRNSSHLLVYNPQQRGRNKLNVAQSKDGINWKDIIVLENEPTGEFSYPAIIQSSNGNIHITYTHQRKKIKHVVLTVN
jgi:alpha-L-fucosidase